MNDTAETQETQEPQETYETYETETQETHEATTSSETRAAAPPAPAAPPPAEPSDVAPPLAALIATIRSALAPGASPEMRTAGATACRSILTVLEAKPGQPLGAPAPVATSQTTPIAALLKQPSALTQLAAMSREQLLDLLRQVTGAMPGQPHTPATAAPRFHLIQIPQIRRPGP